MLLPIQEPGLRNPYYHTSMVRDPDLFFGRQEILRRFYAVIRDQQCLSLVGSRRIGKSSLLNALRSKELQKRFGYDLDRYVLAYIDTGAQPLKSYEDLLEFLGMQLVAQNQDRLASLSTQPKRDASQFSQFLETIKNLGLYPVLLLDEFENIAAAPQFDISFFFFLRAQANMGMISYITASKDTLDKVCHADLVGSPFFNIFTTLHLGALSNEEALELITLPSQKSGQPFSSVEVTWVQDIAGRHPFFIQRACHFLFEAKVMQKHNVLELHKIEQAIYTELLPHFQYAWKHVDAEIQEKLAWEARREGAFTRSLPELNESRLFRHFVRIECGIKLSSITVKQLDDALSNLDDMQFLGKSVFGSLNIIYMQADDTFVSVIARGLHVQRLILTSIEDLRPNMQEKNENDLHWRNYQILSLRHKERLHNEQIAARLSISERHFFRERTKALNALLNVVLKRELLSRE
jgi:AAA-like domain